MFSRHFYAIIKDKCITLIMIICPTLTACATAAVTLLYLNKIINMDFINTASMSTYFLTLFTGLYLSIYCGLIFLLISVAAKIRKVIN